MIMVRGTDGKIRVLYNRCPHRGVQLCGNRQGNTGTTFVCSYHAWTFHLDGRVKGIPLSHGYDGTRMTPDNPDCSMKSAPRVDSYRGFVFASLAAQGPTLLEFLGDARIAFDDMCDRSPEGAADIVPVCHRVIQHSNWKFFMENQLDALHPSVTHQSTGIAAGRVERALKEAGESPPLYYHYYQSELLDQKHWATYIDQFALDGIYWMPVTPEQTEWLDSPSILAEDRRMMEIRMGRVQHPNAWSQAPQ